MTDFITQSFRSNRRIIRVICLLLAFVFAASQALCTQDSGVTQGEPLSKTRIAAITAISALSPGIALLIVSYQVKKERNSQGENDWLLNYVWLFWIIAFVDFILDMLPGVSQINQFVQYGIIWYVAYVVTTCFNADFPMIIGALLGSGVQAGRHAYSSGLDTASAGAASPIRSMLENIIAAISVYFLT